MEIVSHFKFLGVHITEDLTWQMDLLMKAQKHDHFLRRLKKRIKKQPTCLPIQILQTYSRRQLHHGLVCQ